MTAHDEKIWNASDYSKNSSLQFKTAVKLIQEFPFTGNESVLDVGTGDGKIAALLAQHVPNGSVLGIDRSENMINFAKIQHQLPNLSFEQQDAQLLSSNQAFDLIFSNFCLHWVPDKKSAFNRIAQALKPNGHFLASLATLNPVTTRIRRNMVQEKKWKKIFQNFFDVSVFVEDNAYQTYILNANLKILKFEQEEAIEHYDNKIQMSYFFKAILPNIQHLTTHDLQSEFIEEFTTRYLNAHPELSISYNYTKVLAIR